VLFFAAVAEDGDPLGQPFAQEATCGLRAHLSRAVITP
jgi:hypothetical protein